MNLESYIQTIRPEINQNKFERIQKEFEESLRNFKDIKEKKYYVEVKLKDGTFIETPEVNKDKAYLYLQQWGEFNAKDTDDRSIFTLSDQKENVAISFHVRDVLFFIVREGR